MYKEQLTCLQCFNTVGWTSGRASGLKKISDEVLERLNDSNGPADTTATQRRVLLH